MWFTATKRVEETKIVAVDNHPEIKRSLTVKIAKRKPIPLFFKDACSVLDIFTETPLIYKPKMTRKIQMEDDNSISMIGITVFLVILVLNAAIDVLKEKEERKKKLNTEGRRQSLAEFANKKPLRRESSKFSFQLFQIPETTNTEETETRKKLYLRGDSINSYFSDKKPQTETAPASIGDTNEPKLVKRQSIAKLIGARPVPMVRRSSFPVLPLNPEVKALMHTNRQSSFDSDDEVLSENCKLSKNTRMNYEQLPNVLHWNYRGFTEFPLQKLRGEESDVVDIYLKENLISRIPSDICKLSNLESLYLSGNDITELPREISKLRCLKCLDISGNRLRFIPEEIAGARNLKFLILDENELKQLPLRLAEIRTLRYLSITNYNGFHSDPYIIIIIVNLDFGGMFT
ncbi:unnamed protein product [Leptosia nina]|uniref:Disease resistance R13L4/SHOC-2-like LRR domain-containing protein n=1 Tax=Leptosia nina TaxID=320188 RepID=A0AAV1K489_9NEOP